MHGPRAHFFVALACAAFFALFAVTAREARAEVLPVPSLADLVDGSSAIVLATRQTQAAPGERSMYVVTQSYSGELARGDHVAVDDERYPWDLPEGPAPESSQAVLFLYDSDGSVELGGMRLVTPSGVYATRQRHRHYTFVPQASEDDAIHDAWNVPEAPEPLTGFERDLHHAIERVSAFAAARLDPDPIRRRARLMALLPRPSPWPSSPSGSGCPTSSTDAAIVEWFGAEENVPDTLEAAGRLAGYWPNGISGDRIADDDLIAVATNQGAPLASRRAACGGIHWWSDVVQRADVTRSLLALLEDPEPSIRAMAVTHAAGASKRNPLLEEALARLWQTESDPWVRLRIARAADEQGSQERILGPDAAPVLATYISGEYFRYFFANASEVTFTGNAVPLDRTGEARPIALGTIAQPYGRIDEGTARLQLTPAFDSGSYRLELLAHFEGGKTAPVTIETYSPGTRELSCRADVFSD